MPVSPARAAAFDILLRVEQQDSYASELLHSDRLDKLSPADRGLTTEIVMGVLRWRSRLDSALAAQSSRPLEKLDPQVLTALRIAAYQLLYLSRVPARECHLAQAHRHSSRNKHDRNVRHDPRSTRR
jgi:16S rRNA (cytosine967-C5)-methyltransferase